MNPQPRNATRSGSETTSDRVNLGNLSTRPGVERVRDGGQAGGWVERAETRPDWFRLRRLSRDPARRLLRGRAFGLRRGAVPEPGHRLADLQRGVEDLAHRQAAFQPVA